MTKEETEKFKEALKEEENLRNECQKKIERETFARDALKKRRVELLKKARDKDISVEEAEEYGEILISVGLKDARVKDAEKDLKAHETAIVNYGKQIEEAEWDE